MEQRTIAVRAVGKAAVRPDTIFIPITLTAEDSAYQKTTALADERYGALKEALSACGFAADALKSIGFSVDTRYESESDGGVYRQRLVGYTCTHNLQFEFALDMAVLRRVTEALSGSAAEPSYSIRFTVKDREAPTRAALSDAAKNARARAEALAAAAGVSLGVMIRIDHACGEAAFFSETQMDVPAAARKAYAAEIVPDDVNVTESAAFVWEIM